MQHISLDLMFLSALTQLMSKRKLGSARQNEILYKTPTQGFTMWLYKRETISESEMSIYMALASWHHTLSLYLVLLQFHVVYVSPLCSEQNLHHRLVKVKQSHDLQKKIKEKNSMKKMLANVWAAEKYEIHLAEKNGETPS